MDLAASGRCLMNATAIAAGVGFLLPLLVSAIVGVVWPSWLKGVVVLVSSLAAGGVTAWASGDLTGATFGENALIVVGAAIAAFKLFWQPTGIAPWLEKVTDPKTKPPLV